MMDAASSLFFLILMNDEEEELRGKGDRRNEKILYMSIYVADPSLNKVSSRPECE